MKFKLLECIRAEVHGFSESIKSKVERGMKRQ